MLLIFVVFLPSPPNTHLALAKAQVDAARTGPALVGCAVCAEQGELLLSVPVAWTVAGTWHATVGLGHQEWILPSVPSLSGVLFSSLRRNLRDLEAPPEWLEPDAGVWVGSQSGPQELLEQFQEFAGNWMDLTGLPRAPAERPVGQEC